MNDVNLNNPDLRLVRPEDSGRAKASPQAEGSNAPAQFTTTEGIVRIDSATSSQQPSKAQRLGSQNEAERGRLDNAVTRLNDFVQNVQRDLQFEVDNERGKTIVRVVDQQTKQVIRQIPDEVALRLADKLQQDEPLSLFDVKV